MASPRESRPTRVGAHATLFLPSHALPLAITLPFTKPNPSNNITQPGPCLKPHVHQDIKGESPKLKELLPPSGGRAADGTSEGDSGVEKTVCDGKDGDLGDSTIEMAFSGRIGGRANNMMASLRQSMRRPVPSLWQTETQRASTAPASVFTCGSGLNANARAESRDRIQPRSKVGRVTNFGEEVPSRDGGQRKAGGGGGASVGYDGRRASIGGNGGARANISKDALQTKSGSIVLPASAYEPAEDIADESFGRRPTPTPLRSSHRVGPVGALG